MWAVLYFGGTWAYFARCDYMTMASVSKVVVMSWEAGPGFFLDTDTSQLGGAVRERLRPRLIILEAGNCFLIAMALALRF